MHHDDRVGARLGDRDHSVDPPVALDRERATAVVATAALALSPQKTEALMPATGPAVPTRPR
jgi:hypothetical protein